MSGVGVNLRVPLHHLRWSPSPKGEEWGQRSFVAAPHSIHAAHFGMPSM